jgi:hypothetical protein
MPDDKSPDPGPKEKDAALLSQRRGRVAGAIKDPKEKRKFIARQGEGKTSREDLETETQRTTNRMALGSFKRGGRVKKTGIYKVHAGEKVVPAHTRKAKLSGSLNPLRSRIRMKRAKRR